MNNVLRFKFIYPFNIYMQTLEHYVVYLGKIYTSLDKKNRFYIIVDIIFELFRVIMACGLVIFVPQMCYGTSGCQNKAGDEKTVCSINTNLDIRCLTNYNIFVLFFNFFTALSFSFLYFIEIKRDQWIMKHFQKDNDENEAYIERFYLQYDRLFHKLMNYNQLYNVSYKIITFVYITNSILSGTILFYFYYYDVTTVTNLITNLLLCSRKIYLGLFLSHTSLIKNTPTCYYSREFRSFNSIDTGVKNIAKYNNFLDGAIIKTIHNSSDIGPFVGIKHIIHSINTNNNTISHRGSNSLQRINSRESFYSAFSLSSHNSPQQSIDISPQQSIDNSPRQSRDNSPATIKYNDPDVEVNKKRRTSF
jgi:hypothetical protein